MKWHLDGWDADGGRAFASLRPENAELLDQDQTWGPMAYIGPPSFRPEPIANASIALASARAAAFAPRTPAEGRELAFPSADAVAEFVRRAFTSRGAPRGGEGAPAAEGGPREPPVGGDGEGLKRIEFLVAWEGALKHIKDRGGTAEEVRFGVKLAPASPADRSWPAVEAGAVQLVASVASGFPGADDMKAFDRWWPAALNLHRAVEALGLWRAWKRGETIVNLGADWNLGRITREILNQHARFSPSIPGVNPTYFLALLFNQYPAFVAGAKGVTHDYLERLLWISGGISSASPAESTHMDNRLDALYSLPLPMYARHPNDVRNVGELLMKFVSAPDHFLSAHPRLIDLVAFGAALLAANTEDHAVSGWRERAAENWLAGSMPRWLFAEGAEQAIREPVMVNQMAYA